MPAAHESATFRQVPLTPPRRALVMARERSSRATLEITLDIESDQAIDLERLRSASAVLDVDGGPAPLLTFRDVCSMPHPAENIPIEIDLDRARRRIEGEDGAAFEMLVHHVAGGRYVVHYVARRAQMDGAGLLRIHEHLWAAYERPTPM